MEEKLSRKIKRWSPEEESILRKIWDSTPYSKIALSLGRTAAFIKMKAASIGLSPKIKEKFTPYGLDSIKLKWQQSEDLILLKNAGHLNLSELSAILPKRTKLAIKQRCRFLGFAPNQGTYTCAQIVRETGYDSQQIFRARDGLGQAWKRYGEKSFMISFDQVQDIIEYLKNESRKWSHHYNLTKCVNCGSSNQKKISKHASDGLCKVCFDRRRFDRDKLVKMIKNEKVVIISKSIWLNMIRD
jgi:hypothetical protein